MFDEFCLAFTSISQVCESTGVVVAPYLDYPQLLGVLLRCVFLICSSP